MNTTTIAPEKRGKQISEGLLLLTLASINFVHIMDFVVMAPLNPILRQALNINTKEFSLLLGSYNVAAAISGIVGSFIIDRYDRRTALIFLVIGFTVSNLACAVSQDFNLLMISRIMAGAFGGVLGSLVLSIVGDSVPQERRGKATGIVMAAFSAASVLGIPTGLFLASKFDWHAPFFLLTGLSLLVLLLVFFKMPSITKHMENKSGETQVQKILSIFANKNLLWSFLMTIFLMLAGFTIVPFLSDYNVNNLGIPLDHLLYIYIFGGLASAVSSPLTGKLADKYGKHKVFVVAATLSMIPIYAVTHISAMPEYQVYILSTIFFIFFGARFVPAISMVTSSVEVRQRGSFMSINSSVQQFSSALALLISGSILVNAPDGSLVNFGTCGVIACIATVICIGISYKVKQVS